MNFDTEFIKYVGNFNPTTSGPTYKIKGQYLKAAGLTDGTTFSL